MKKHNFCSGPAMLPAQVFRKASKAVLDLDDSGLSILEISHRSEAFSAIMDEARFRVKELMGLGDEYHVLFLQGGASSQFYMVPLNLLPKNGIAAYLNTGTWSQKAIREAQKFGETVTVASSEDASFSFVPKDYQIPKNSDYFHYTTNNTIYGTQIRDIPSLEVSETKTSLVADMSSDIFSRLTDFSRFDLIYAGAQKNLGPAGTTIVVVNEKILGRTDRDIPSMLDYRMHIDKGSMYNTPPTFAVYCCLLTLRWIEEMGGLSALARINEKKAARLYKEIDSNPLFEGNVRKEDRSLMNVTFHLTDTSMEEAFIKMAEENDIVGIRGHRSVGGLRASIYNAMEMSSVEHLCEVMHKFAINQ